MKVYLAGPMSGIPKFNFPAFEAATSELRKQGFEVVSPAEEDYKHGVGKEAVKSTDGNPDDLSETWGDLLARDVKIIADGGIEGIVFLPGWTKSRGARLEATLGILCDLKFYRWVDCYPETGGVAWPLNKRDVALQLYIAA